MSENKNHRVRNVVNGTVRGVQVGHDTSDDDGPVEVHNEVNGDVYGVQAAVLDGGVHFGR